MLTEKNMFPDANGFDDKLRFYYVRYIWSFHDLNHNFCYFVRTLARCVGLVNYSWFKHDVNWFPFTSWKYISSYSSCNKFEENYFRVQL